LMALTKQGVSTEPTSPHRAVMLLLIDYIQRAQSGCREADTRQGNVGNKRRRVISISEPAPSRQQGHLRSIPERDACRQCVPTCCITHSRSAARRRSRPRYVVRRTARECPWSDHQTAMATCGRRGWCADRSGSDKLRHRPTHYLAAQFRNIAVGISTSVASVG